MKIFSGILLILVVSITKYAETKWIPNFFVPEELPTILQLLYSRLPPTKIGSDKRFGIGFRLGKNADAQILVELGPQSETQPLGNSNNGFSKRQSREHPTDGYKRSNYIPVDSKTEQTNNIDIELNQTNSIKKINTTQSDLGFQIPANPFDSLRNLFMRWLRWMTEPKLDDNARFNQVERAKKKEVEEQDVGVIKPKHENIIR